MRGRPWTQREDAILRELYTTGGVPAVQSELPHRSAMGIQQRAHRLDLTIQQQDHSSRTGLIKVDCRELAAALGMAVTPRAPAVTRVHRLKP